MSEYKFFSEESLEELSIAIRRIGPSYLVASEYLLGRLDSEGVAREYITQGFLRRLSTMARCIEQIFCICPPDTCKLADSSVATDVGIYLQAFYINLYGAFENLARVCIEKSDAVLSEPEKRTASFLSKKLDKKIKSALPPTLLDYHSTSEMSSWREHLKEFRHALAHRIPLYVPPFRMRPEDVCLYNELEAESHRLLNECTRLVMKKQISYENSIRNNEMIDRYRQKIAEIKQRQSELEFFCPIATHSFTEGGGLIGFHAQVIANWNTIFDFVYHFLEAMQPPLGKQYKKELIATGISCADHFG